MSVFLETSLDIKASAATFDTPDGYVQHYRGLKMWKTADDLERYRLVLESTRPELVIETGTRWGGFAEWLAEEFGVDVVTVDIQPISGFGPSSSRVTSIRGNSANIGTVEQVAGLVSGARTMVVLDSDHHAPHVVREIRAYAPMVSPGCYLVVEDGIADLAGEDVARRCGNDIPRQGGPLVAITQELINRPDPIFTRDRALEDLTPISHHPAGWWIRD